MKIYNNVNDEILEEIKRVLDNDGLIIFPTDTVYGIACNSYSDKAILKLFRAKNRPLSNPIGVLTSSIDKIALITKNISNKEIELINRYMPGNLTIILNKKDNISNLLTANNNTIGVRIPDNDLALKILDFYPYPLATTSVNISSFKPGSKINDFYEEFKDKVDIIIDGGNTSETPSTIIKVINNEIVILRQGDLVINT